MPMGINERIAFYLQERTHSIERLVSFRLIFGALMLYSAVRFLVFGWVDKLYIQPQFFFSYFGFSWVKPLGMGTYVLFALLVVSAIAVIVGWRYKLFSAVLFLIFTYIELMDKTTYLNHYYFVSSVAFLMMFMPAHKNYSLDSLAGRVQRAQKIPAIYIHSILVFISIVYFYAGIAKINSDWLLEALPLKIWLTNMYDLPIIGGLLERHWVHVGFSWAGMLYDVTIAFLLWNQRTRLFGFIGVVVFHVLTKMLFPIGVFPWVMIGTASLFFGDAIHKRIVYFFYRKNKSNNVLHLNSIYKYIVILFFCIHILIPWRFLCYPGNLFWTEQGYRFSWRVMLMEKRGDAQFRIEIPSKNQSFYIDNSRYLTTFQQKQMATQPDMILEYAHFLGNSFSRQEKEDVAVYVTSYVSLNGRASKLFVDPTVNLMGIRPSLKHKTWILPYEN